MRAKYTGYCQRCHFTIVRGEEIVLNGGAQHINCVEALQDYVPRRFDPRFKEVYGDVRRKTMRKQLEANPFTRLRREPAPKVAG